MAITQPIRRHWTDVDRWQNRESGEILTAGELLKRFDRFFRCARGFSLCSLPHGAVVRGEDNSTWIQIERA